LDSGVFDCLLELRVRRLSLPAANVKDAGNRQAYTSGTFNCLSCSILAFSKGSMLSVYCTTKHNSVRRKEHSADRLAERALLAVIVKAISADKSRPVRA